MNATRIFCAALFALVLSAGSFAAVHAGAQHGGDHAAAPADHAAAPAAAAAPDHGAAAAPEHGGGEHAEGHGEGHALKPINWADFGNKEQAPYVSQLINFGVLLAIFYIFGKKPIAEGLVARRASVAKQIEEAQKMKAEAAERAKIYQAKLDSLEADLATTKAALIEAGKGERDRIIKEAEEKAERMARDAKEQIEQEAKQMQQDLVRETVEIALAAAEEILKQKITPADHERLADEYLSSLGKPASNASAAGGSSMSPPRGAS
jgi:F-type H+-transporting ATPase subunit b